MKDSNRILMIKVLMYHRVLAEKPEQESRWHYVTVDDFKKQMNLIDRMGYTPITFSDYQLCKEGKLTMPSKPIIITFDDGYLDTLENAIPILLELNMRAVIFVMGNRKLERARWDELGDFDSCPLMSDEQIRTVEKMGFEIGAHSHDHFPLTSLSEDDIEYEVVRSKEEIENVLQKPIQTFSYPYGNVNDRVKKIVSDSGFLFACGVFTGSAKFSQSIFDFRRLAVNQHTSRLKFLFILLLPYQYIEWLYFRMKTRMTSDVGLEQHSTIKSHSNNGMKKSEDHDIQNILNTKS